MILVTADVIGLNPIVPHEPGFNAINAFDRVPREVIRFALLRKGVPEYLVNGVMSLYEGCKTAVLVDGELSSSFSVKVGVHQGSALSPHLFIIVMDVLTQDV